MALKFDNGDVFAPGESTYDDRPATSRETTSRVFVEVIIDHIRTDAMVDTGSVYFLCSPQIANQLHLDDTESLGIENILIRGVNIQGRLHRIPLTIQAEIGESLELEVTAFVPDQSRVDWEDFPCILGFQGCLERIRFALDPHTNTFYFGPVS